MSYNTLYDLLPLSLSPPHSQCFSYSDHLEMQVTVFYSLGISSSLYLKLSPPIYFQGVSSPSYQACIGISLYQLNLTSNLKLQFTTPDLPFFPWLYFIFLHRSHQNFMSCIYRLLCLLSIFSLISMGTLFSFVLCYIFCWSYWHKIYSHLIAIINKCMNGMPMSYHHI